MINIEIMPIEDILRQYNKGMYDKKKTSYKHVDIIETKFGSVVRAQLTKYKWCKFFELTEDRKAAIAVDKKLLERGELPLNILKKV